MQLFVIKLNGMTTAEKDDFYKLIIFVTVLTAGIKELKKFFQPKVKEKKRKIF